MKNKLSIATFILLCAAGLTLAEAPQARKVSPVKQWEYGEFSIVSDGPFTYQWIAPGVEVKAATWEDFGTKYPQPFRVGNYSYVTIFNVLGADGWEFCDRSTRPPSNSIWLFKREVR